MCGCSRTSGVASRNQTQNSQPIDTSNCEYTIDNINDWKIRLQCVGGNDQLSLINLQKALYNSFVGILISVQNNPNMLCYFNKDLQIIEPYILNIINQELC